MSKYDKSYDIFITNQSTQNPAPTSNTMYKFFLSKPIIIPPYSTYSLSNLSVNVSGNAGINFVFSIAEFPNKTYIGNLDGGKMTNGFLYTTSRLNNNLQHEIQPIAHSIENPQPLTISSLTLRVSDLLGNPRYLTQTGLVGGTIIMIGMNIHIQQSEKYIQSNIMKRNHELMMGLIAQRKEINQQSIENI
tara:strand:- start:15176 stop:15745 length:570 start_codon:yes stop_codon:yes gene_type:complete